MRGRLFSFIACLCVPALCTFPSYGAEPIHDGKNLSEWLDLYAKAQAESTDVGQAKTALRSIGTNAIPCLLDWGESDHWQIRTRSCTGFQFLGSLAAPAVPTLARRLVETNEDFAIAAAKSLNGMGAPALPALMRAITNRQSGIRTYALEFIDLTPSARSIMPVLIRDIEHRNPYFRWRAAQALGSLHLEPETIVPKLSKLLQDESATVRYSTLNALGKFKSSAAPAIPAISKLLVDPEFPVRFQATNALARITTPFVIFSGQMHPGLP